MHILKTIVYHLGLVGVQVLTYAADGDSRELKVVRQLLCLGIQLSEQPRAQQNI